MSIISTPFGDFDSILLGSIFVYMAINFHFSYEALEYIKSDESEGFWEMKNHPAKKKLQSSVVLQALVFLVFTVLLLPVLLLTCIETLFD